MASAWEIGLLWGWLGLGVARSGSEKVGKLLKLELALEGGCGVGHSVVLDSLWPCQYEEDQTHNIEFDDTLDLNDDDDKGEVLDGERRCLPSTPNTHTQG